MPNLTTDEYMTLRHLAEHGKLIRREDGKYEVYNGHMVNEDTLVRMRTNELLTLTNIATGKGLRAVQKGSY
jgi:hypothetical protein